MSSDFHAVLIIPCFSYYKKVVSWRKDATRCLSTTDIRVMEDYSTMSSDFHAVLLFPCFSYYKKVVNWRKDATRCFTTTKLEWDEGYTSSLSMVERRFIMTSCLLGNLKQSPCIAFTTTILNSSGISDMKLWICFISRSILPSFPVWGGITLTFCLIHLHLFISKSRKSLNIKVF